MSFMLVDNMFNESPLFIQSNTYAYSLINNYTNSFHTHIATVKRSQPFCRYHDLCFRF